MKTLKNYFYNLAYQITALIVPFVTTPYISRIFGADGIGKYAVSYAIAQYFTLVGLLGINTYGVRQIAYYRDDKKNLYKIFWNLNYMRFITMGVSIFLFVIYIIFFVRESERIIYIAQSGVLLSSFFDISWYFSGTEQFKFTAIRNILVKLLGMILVFIFVKEKEDVWLYSFILALSLLLGQLSMWRIAFRSIPLVRPDTKMIKMFLKETFRLWIPAIAINIYTSLDKVMLGFLVGDSEAGIYENSQKTIRMVSTVTTTLATVMTPRMANLYKNGDLKLLKDGVFKSFRAVSIIAIPMVFGIIAIRNTFVPWFFGAGFEKISQLLIISAWLVLTLSWSNVLGNQVLIACNKEKFFTISVTFAAIFNLFANFVLIPKFHSLGAIISSVIAEYIGMFLMMFFSRDIIKANILIKGIWKYIVISLFMYIIIYKLGELIGCIPISTMFQIVLGILIYSIGIIFFKDPFVEEILKKYIKVIKNKRHGW